MWKWRNSKEIAKTESKRRAYKETWKLFKDFKHQI